MCIYISKIPTEKGKEWDHVTIIELKDRTHQQKVECKYCKHVFEAGASRIREHFLHICLTCGVAKCTADEAVQQPVLDKMRAINALNKEEVAAAPPAWEVFSNDEDCQGSDAEDSSSSDEDSSSDEEKIRTRLHKVPCFS